MSKLIGHDPLPANAALKWLEPAIRMWTKVHCIYAEVFKEDDALYWYNERPQVGALAAAAWKANMYALEEYATTKHHPITKKKTGRIDLYIGDHNGHSATLEAKLSWVNPDTRLEKLDAKMQWALDDARLDDDPSLQNWRGIPCNARQRE
jgi:hypothetical protein